MDVGHSRGLKTVQYCCVIPSAFLASGLYEFTLTKNWITLVSGEVSGYTQISQFMSSGKMISITSRHLHPKYDHLSSKKKKFLVRIDRLPTRNTI